MKTIYKTDFKDIKLFCRGKVRDIYEIDEYLLFIATDRISAFDVIMNEPIPNKGTILTKISEYWFKHTEHIIKNHFISTNISEYPDVCQKYYNELAGRSMLVKKSKPILLECVVRGYIAGSGWKEYQTTKTICNIPIKEGLKEYDKLETPIFTPSTKAATGHDENISFDKAIEIVGKNTAEQIKNYSISLYNFAYKHLYKRGIILADTKFEFGIINDEIILIDEAITPDSSRFWLLSDYETGKSPINFDKQVLRDWLEQSGWNKQPPPPNLPTNIISKTIEKYDFILQKIIL